MEQSALKTDHKFTAIYDPKMELGQRAYEARRAVVDYPDGEAPLCWDELDEREQCAEQVGAEAAVMHLGPH